MRRQHNIITCTSLGSLGRLGNQLFQIAAVIGVAKLHGMVPRFLRWHCNYEYEYFSRYFKNRIDETLDISLIKYVYREPEFEFRPVLEIKESLNLYGYYQSEKYFQHCLDDIRHFLEPEYFVVEKICRKYKSELEGQPCSIHVRRGDYVGNKIHEVCDLDYYNRCVEHMKKLGINKFLVFSDDISWCKDNLDNHFHFIEGNNSIEDLFLMSFCKHNIIPNSTFSWWGSWLNKNPQKVVCAPSKWFADGAPINKYESIYRKDMIRI